MQLLGTFGVRVSVRVMVRARVSVRLRVRLRLWARLRLMCRVRPYLYAACRRWVAPCSLSWS